MKIISSVFEYPGYAVAWDRFVDASNRISDELRKAGIPVSLLDDLEIAFAKLAKIDAQYQQYKRYTYIPLYTPEELTRRVRAGEEF